MSTKMGPLTFGKTEEHIFLGKELARPKDYSEKTAIDIDSEIKRIVTESFEKAKELLKENTNKLNILALALLEKEVLTAENIDKLLGMETTSEAA